MGKARDMTGMKCQECGVPLTAYKRRFCSNECRKKNWDRCVSLDVFIGRWGTPDAPRRKCDYCKRPFIPHRMASNVNHTRFCSRRCRTLAHRDDRQTPGEFKFVAECQVCDRPIDFDEILPSGRRRRRDSTTCSPKCKTAHKSSVERVRRGTQRFMSSVDALERKRYRHKEPALLQELVAIIRERKGKDSAYERAAVPVDRELQDTLQQDHRE